MILLNSIVLMPPGFVQRLDETRHINQSLAALGNVIAALTQRPHGTTGELGHVSVHHCALPRLSWWFNCTTLLH